jgi:hypothetical protein
MKKYLLHQLLIFAGLAAGAQTGLTNHGSLKISPGSAMTVFGAFQNNSGAGFVNDGNLYVRGNLQNSQASISPGTGILTLNGTALQTISGSEIFRTNGLVTNNPAGIQINNDLSIAGTHTFSAGLISTSSTPNYVIYQSAASHNGSSDERHVNGFVKKIGSTNFTFPVGDNTYLRSISITNLSAAGEYAARYYVATPNTSELQAPLVSLDPNEYWEVNRLSGGTAQLSLNWDASKVAIPNWLMSEIKVAGYDGSYWLNRGGTASGDIAGTGTITSDLTSTFNLFTLGSTASIVPLTLVKFEATKLTGSTRIDWITNNERNVDHFILERSDNNISFYAIAKVDARNMGNTQRYSSNDAGAISGTAYYRLKITDRDGKEKYSFITKVSASNTTGIQLLANPVKNNLRIRSMNLDGIFNYTIHGNAGQIIAQGKTNISNGMQFLLDLPTNTRNGYYTISFSKGTEVYITRFIVQN